MTKSKKKVKKKEVSIVGIALAGAAVAAAAGVAYLASPKGVKHRTQLRGWMLKAKGEVMEKLEKAKNITQKDYDEIVVMVLNKYKKLQSVKNTDVKALEKDLKKHWKTITSEITAAQKNVKKRTTTAAKKVTQSPTKKKRARSTKKRTTKKK